MRFILCLTLVILTPLFMGAAPKSSSLRLEISLVAGRDGDKLTAGDLGYMVLRFRNTSQSETVCICTACFQGKGAEGPGKKMLVPSSQLKEGQYTYAGFAVADCAYAFVPETAAEHKTDWLPLSPPDSPLELKAGESREVWRLVRAPQAPGQYKMRVKFNNEKAEEAMHAYNLVGGHLTVPGESGPTVASGPFAIQATADKIEIAPRK